LNGAKLEKLDKNKNDFCQLVRFLTKL